MEKNDTLCRIKLLNNVYTKLLVNNSTNTRIEIASKGGNT